MHLCGEASLFKVDRHASSDLHIADYVRAHDKQLFALYEIRYPTFLVDAPVKVPRTTLLPASAAYQKVVQLVALEIAAEAGYEPLNDRNNPFTSKVLCF